MVLVAGVKVQPPEPEQNRSVNHPVRKPAEPAATIVGVAEVALSSTVLPQSPVEIAYDAPDWRLTDGTRDRIPVLPTMGFDGLPDIPQPPERVLMPPLPVLMDGKPWADASEARSSTRQVLFRVWLMLNWHRMVLLERAAEWSFRKLDAM